MLPGRNVEVINMLIVFDLVLYSPQMLNIINWYIIII